MAKLNQFASHGKGNSRSGGNEKNQNKLAANELGLATSNHKYKNQGLPSYFSHFFLDDQCFCNFWAM